MKIRTGISIIAIIVASTMAIAQYRMETTENNSEGGRTFWLTAHQGADVYQTKCQRCHGSTGVPSEEVAKYVGVKPVTDPAVKAMSMEKMIAITTKGLGKMPAFKGTLTDDQIKDSVSYFRTLIR